jgi:cyclic-di-AMP phosphodiesterase PgpH
MMPMAKEKSGRKKRRFATQFSSAREKGWQSFLANEGIIQQSRLRLFLIILAFSFLISLFISGNGSSQIPVLIAGTYSQKSIRAPYDFELIDEEATEKKRVQAINLSPPVIDFDPEVLKSSKTRLNNAFVVIQSAYAKMSVTTDPTANDEKLKSQKPTDLPAGATQAPILDPAKLKEAEKEFASILNLPLSKGDLGFLRKHQYGQTISEAVIKLMALTESNYIAVDLPDLVTLLKKSFPDPKTPPRIQIRNIKSQSEKTLTELGNVIDITAAYKTIDEAAKSFAKDGEKGLAPIITKIAQGLIRPNAGINVDETKIRKQRAAQEVIPVRLVYKKNRLIIGEGHIVTEDQAKVLKWLVEQESLEGILFKLAGLSLTLAILFFATLLIVVNNISDLKVREKDFIFIGILLLITIAALRLFMALGEILAEREYGFPPMAITLLFPFAASTMLVRFIFRFEMAFVFAVCAALINGLMVQLDFPMAIYFFISSFVGAHFMGNATRRADIIKAGFFVGAVNLILVGCMILFIGDFHNIFSLSFYSLAGGVLCGLFVIAMTPLAEWSFGYMTPVALQELASYEHPLLREIMTKTPGTFQHSVTIGTLAEAAAESIGADALLCRVGALFHDAGKSMNPEWFVENQSRTNPHDDLDDPYKSAAIIKRHVTHGVVLARQYHLGQRITDFIQEHHGTGAIKYFLAKATESAGGDPEIFDETAFHYDGPRPRSKETGILMIADAIEATSRTLSDRSQEAMLEMIDKTIARLQIAGQLANTPLTQKDLSTISESFCRVLIGSHHAKINYND